MATNIAQTADTTIAAPCVGTISNVLTLLSTP
jgi:hypothetical protein